MIGRLLRAIAPPRPDREPLGGGLPWSDVYPDRPGAGLALRRYTPPRAVGATLAPTILALANVARASLVIVNDGTANLYLGLGPSVSTVSFDAKLGAGQSFVLEPPDPYQGDVAGVWDAVNGSARITETT